MRTRALVATTLLVALQSGSGIAVSHAADLIWEVENPYRVFKRTASFEMHEKAFEAVRGPAGRHVNEMLEKRALAQN